MTQSLTPSHVAYLAERGIKEEVARKLYAAEGEDLLIPFKDPDGTAYQDCNGDPFIVRRPFPTGKPKFKAPLASGSRPYFSPLMAEDHLDNVEIPLVFIEGPIKVDAAWSFVPQGFCFVGVTGTWNFLDARDEDGIWQPEGETRALPELKALRMTGRKCIILYDSDIIYKPSVELAAARFEQWLRTQGAIPYRCELPNEANGDKNGADDFLVRHGEVQLFDLLENESVHSGWPLPASLLTDAGDLLPRYTPRQVKILIRELAQLDDQTIRILAINAISGKVKMKPDAFAKAIIDERFGVKRCDPLKPGDSADFRDPSWLWDGVIKEGTTNMIVASPKVGKSALIVQMIAAIHHKRGSLLGHEVKTMDRLPVVLVGIDQPGADWKHYFRICGLDETGSNIPEPLVSFATKEHPQHLDDEGMERIQECCERNPGALVVIDSYFKACAPLGLEENSSLMSMPLLELEARLAGLSEPPTIVIVHHANRKNAGSGTDASRGHSSLPSIPSNIVYMRWLHPAQEGAEQKDRRVSIDTEGRSAASRIVGEMTDDGWIVSDGADESIEVDLQDAQERKLNTEQRNVLEYIRERHATSNGASVATTELLEVHGVKYTQKARRICLRLQNLGLVEQDGSIPSHGGGGNMALWKPVSSVSGKKEREFSCVSSSSGFSVPPHKTREDRKTHENTPLRARVGEEVERLRPDGTWEQGWKLSSKTTSEHQVAISRVFCGEPQIKHGFRWDIDVRPITHLPQTPASDDNTQQDYSEVPAADLWPDL